MSKTEVKDLIDQIDQLLFIRNLLGCHYNEWAESLSDSEVENPGSDDPLDQVELTP